MADKKVLAAIETIEALPSIDQKRVIHYMLSVTDLGKDKKFLAHLNKITFGLISRGKVDDLVDEDID